MGSNLAAVTGKRRRKFPSKEAAYESLKAKFPYVLLDPESLACYVEHGLKESPGDITKPKTQMDTSPFKRPTHNAEYSHKRPIHDHKRPIHNAEYCLMCQAVRSLALDERKS